MSHLHLRVFGKVSVCGYHLEQEGRGAEKEIPKLPEKFFLACLLVKDSIKSDIWIKACKHICCPASVLNFYKRGVLKSDDTMVLNQDPAAPIDT